jgi:hypothetical protein
MAAVHAAATTATGQNLAIALALLGKLITSSHIDR